MPVMRRYRVRVVMGLGALMLLAGAMLSPLGAWVAEAGHCSMVAPTFVVNSSSAGSQAIAGSGTGCGKSTNQQYRVVVTLKTQRSGGTTFTSTCFGPVRNSGSGTSVCVVTGITYSHGGAQVHAWAWGTAQVRTCGSSGCTGWSNHQTGPTGHLYFYP